MEKIASVSFNKDIEMDIRHDEELIMRFIPQKKAHVWLLPLAFLPFVLIWLGLEIWFMDLLFGAGLPTFIVVFLSLFFVIHLAPVWMEIFLIIKALKTHKDIEYALTDKRIIARKKDKLTSFYYDRLLCASIRIGLLSKLFKVGNVELFKLDASLDLDLETLNPENFVFRIRNIENAAEIGKTINDYINLAGQNRRLQLMQNSQNENEKSLPRSNGMFTPTKMSSIDDNNEHAKKE